MPSRGGAPATEAAADVDQSDVSTVAAPSQLPSAQETPATSQAPSEADVSVAAPSPAPAESSKPATPQGQAKKDARPAIPIVPAVPAARPKTASSETVPTPASTTEQSAPANAQADAPAEGNPAEPATPAPKAAPKSWADLMRSKNSAAAAAATASTVAVNGASPTNGAPPSRASTLAGALKQFNVDDNDKIAFLEPRGLVNTGNMCYMNSVRWASNPGTECLTKLFRFFKYLYTVCLFTTSWIRSARELLILSRVILLLSTLCEFGLLGSQEMILTIIGLCS